MKPSNEDLAALVLAWAKTNEPDAYAKTLAVATKPETFRRYLVRLVEIRCEIEPDWRLFVPLRMLEQTALRIRMKHRPSDTIIEVAGEAAVGSRSWAFGELAALIDGGASGADLLSLNTMKLALDLELVEFKDGSPIIRNKRDTVT